MPFVAFYHTHKLVVVLFLLLYLIKTILLLSNQKNALAKFTKVTKVPEMIISALFLITGIVMLTKLPELTTTFAIKLTSVALAIPLAIIGFKKQNKLLASLAMLLIISAYGLAEMNKAMYGKRQPVEIAIDDPNNSNYSLQEHGKALYSAQCAVCHGDDGTLNMSGAKNLKTSQVDDQYIVNIINNGKNTMPKMAGKYDDQEMKALIAYVKSLRD